MPRGVWSPKRERQYEHILGSCMTASFGRGAHTCSTKRCVDKRIARCKRIAAATVNKTRTARCETKACRAKRKRGRR